MDEEQVARSVPFGLSGAEWGSIAQATKANVAGPTCAEIVGDKSHELAHRARHDDLYWPLFEKTFGAPSTWGDRLALVMFAGQGREAEMLAPHCQHVVCVDANPSCVKHLLHLFAARPNVTVIENNAVDLCGVPSGSVDMLTALVALMHIQHRCVRDNYLSEFVRVLDPNGTALLQFCEGSDWHVRATTGYGNLPDVGFPSEHALRQYLGQWLTVRDVYTTGPINHPQSARWWWAACARK